jgi:hypothetical protein
MGKIETVEGLSHDISLVKTEGWVYLRQKKKRRASGHL